MRRRNSTPPPQGESAGGLEGKTDAAEEKEITFTEQVVADNEECKITITGIEGNDKQGYLYLNTLCENKSSDKTYKFTLDSAAVNGVSLPTFNVGFYWLVLAPGEKRNEKINLSDVFFNYNDIGDYTDIELVFQVREVDEDGFSNANVLERKTVHIYPYGEDKAAEFVREAQPSDKVILDNEYATVIFGECNEKFKEKMGSEYYHFEMFVINKTDKPLFIVGGYKSFSVNGQEASSSWSAEVDGGKCSFSTMHFSKEDLEKTGIKDYEDFEEIKFILKIYDFNIDDYGFLDSTCGDDNLLGEYEITLNP